MIVDTSALLAVLLREPEHESFLTALGDLQPVSIGAPTRFELMMVCRSRGRAALQQRADDLLADAFVETIPFTEELSAIAREAFSRYGKGQGHPAQLNFGDCMSYAVAKGLGQPLLYKGDDFSHTDIISAI